MKDNTNNHYCFLKTTTKFTLTYKVIGIIFSLFLALKLFFCFHKQREKYCQRLKKVNSYIIFHKVFFKIQFSNKYLKNL